MLSRLLLPRLPAAQLRARGRGRYTAAGLLATALVCLLGQGASLAHLALVQHASCPEHDALVHAAAPSSDAQLDADRGVHSAGNRISAPPVGSDGHDEDHCLVVAFRRRELASLETEPMGLAPISQARQLTAAAAGSLPPFPIPLLLLAPKSSPPAA